eukprot:g4598.t1
MGKCRAYSQMPRCVCAMRNLMMAISTFLFFIVIHHDTAHGYPAYNAASCGNLKGWIGPGRASKDWRHTITMSNNHVRHMLTQVEDKNSIVRTSVAWEDNQYWDAGSLPTSKDSVILLPHESININISTPVRINSLQVFPHSRNKQQHLTITPDGSLVADGFINNCYARLPESPKGFNITNITVNSVTLKWEKPVQSDPINNPLLSFKFDVWNVNNGKMYSHRINISEVMKRKFIITKLRPNTFYRILATAESWLGETSIKFSIPFKTYNIQKPPWWPLPVHPPHQKPKPDIDYSKIPIYTCSENKSIEWKQKDNSSLWGSVLPMEKYADTTVNINLEHTNVSITIAKPLVTIGSLEMFGF